MMPDDPLFLRIVMRCVMYVFVPALLIMGLAIIGFFVLGMVQVMS